MLTKITMPSGGTNTDRLRVAAWRKEVGDPVKRGDILFEIETDKAVMEVESFAEGTLLKRLVEAGDSATVGDVVAYVGGPGDIEKVDVPQPASAPSHAAGTAPEEVDDFVPIMAQAAAGSHEPSVSTPGARPEGPIKATPAAKKAARDLGVDLADVRRGTDKEILRREDIAEFARRAPSRSVIPVASGDVMASDLVPLTSMRRVITERMEAASRVPTFTAEIEVDMSNCIRLRSDLNQHASGVKFAYHDIIAKCAAIAARDYPFVNASFTDRGIKTFRFVNVGIAVSVENGLVAPVVCDVLGKDLPAIARENAGNVAQVRSGKYDGKLLENGTFTISNLGMYPVSRFTAILNPPQASILAVGKIETRPVWVDGQWRAEPTGVLTATFDHRVVDGSYGAAFLSRLKELLEHPYLLFLR